MDIKDEDTATPNPPGQDEIDDGDRSSFLSRVQNAWRQTVGTYATGEGETQNLFGRLVDFGNITGDEAKKLLAETQERIDQNRRELEHRVEASVKKAGWRPKGISDDDRAELSVLEKKIDAIEARIQSLEQGSP